MAVFDAAIFDSAIFDTGGVTPPVVVAQTVTGGSRSVRRHHFIWSEPEEEKPVAPKRRKYVAKPTEIHEAIMSFAPRSVSLLPVLREINLDIPRPLPKDEDEDDFMNFLEME